MRSYVTSGAIWENKVGYCRAVKSGNHIEVSGTTAFREGKIVAPENAYCQTIVIFEIIHEALQNLGASLKDIVRTRVYLKNIKDWEEVARAHGELFRDIMPASTMLAVADFIHPDMLVEIEATAILTES